MNGGFWVLRLLLSRMWLWVFCVVNVFVVVLGVVCEVGM